MLVCNFHHAKQRVHHNKCSFASSTNSAGGADLSLQMLLLIAIATVQHKCKLHDAHVHARHTGMQVGASGQSPQEHLKAESQQAGMLSFIAAMPAGVFCSPGKSI